LRATSIADAPSLQGNDQSQVASRTRPAKTRSHLNARALSPKCDCETARKMKVSNCQTPPTSGPGHLQRSDYRKLYVDIISRRKVHNTFPGQDVIDACHGPDLYVRLSEEIDSSTFGWTWECSTSWTTATLHTMGDANRSDESLQLSHWVVASIYVLEVGKP
jgi:hypothetical protein